MLVSASAVPFLREIMIFREETKDRRTIDRVMDTVRDFVDKEDGNGYVLYMAAACLLHMGVLCTLLYVGPFRY